MPFREDKPVGKNAIQRLPQVEIKIIAWDWQKGTIKSEQSVEADSAINMQWQKSIKTPSGSCTITLVAENDAGSFYNQIHILDVIQIYEFSKLKWQGYVSLVAFSGYINMQGKPQRTVIVYGASFGTYIMRGSVGVDLSIHEKTTDLYIASSKLADDITKAAEDGLSLLEITKIITDSWFTFLDTIMNSTKQSYYIKSYVDFITAIDSVTTSNTPKEIFMFQGDTQSLTLWQLLQKISEAPFNEYFFVEGPRDVWVNGSTIKLAEDKTYLVGRPTPFDGSIDLLSGAESDRFSSMPFTTIPLSHLLRFDFNKSMEEALSAYIVNPAIVDLSKVELAAIGGYALDQDNLEKYGYIETVKNLYYLRVAKKSRAEKEPNAFNIDVVSQRAADMLKNWYHNNDIFTSGAITHMVPSDSSKDPRIGEKVEIENVDAYFYVEGVSHMWMYGGALRSNLSVTRGLSKYGTEVKLLNKVFKRGRKVS